VPGILNFCTTLQGRSIEMGETSRRAFLGLLAGAGSGLLVAGAEAAGQTRAVNNDELGMLYDATRCVGCKACMTACKSVNLETGALSYEQAPFDPDRLWDTPDDLSGSTRTIIKLYKENPARWSYVKYSCMHCQEPSCVSVCPVSAMTKEKVTGIVDYDKKKCIGCRYCQIACVFNIPRFQWDRKAPQIVKCDLCRHTNLRVKKLPACAEVCPAQAISFGKRGMLLQDARARISADSLRYVDYIYGEHEAGGTNQLYLAGLPFADLGLRELPNRAPAEFSERIQHTIYRGFIAPVALYGVLFAIALRNRRKAQGGGSDPGSDHDGAQ
jgi:Fe-S-cluster-containing dehydrogenase component